MTIILFIFQRENIFVYIGMSHLEKLHMFIMNIHINSQSENIEDQIM